MGKEGKILQTIRKNSTNNSWDYYMSGGLRNLQKNPKGKMNRGKRRGLSQKVGTAAAGVC